MSRIQATPEILAIHRELLIKDVKIQQLTEELENNHKKVIKEFMGDNFYLVDADGVLLVRYKEHSEKRFNLDWFKILHPDMYEKYKVPGKQRPFDYKV